MVNIIKFCPGAIFGARGWTPVVRLMRNGKPVGSKTGPAMLTRDEAENHAIRAAHYVASRVTEPFEDGTVFVVSGGDFAVAA